MLTLPRPLPREPFPLPDHRPDWAFVAGSWGDVLCACGNVEHLLQECGGQSLGVVYAGAERQIADWLALQPWARAVRWVRTPDRETYLELARRCGERPDGGDWLAETLRGTGIKPADVWPCQVDFSLRRCFTVHRPARLVLPDAVREWAAAAVPDGREVWLVQPRSEANCPWPAHWPHWAEVIAALVDRGQALLLCGHGFDRRCFGRHPGLLNAVGRTPSMLHVWALAERCALTLTTSNSLGHWCAAQGLPAVVAVNATHDRPQQYFTRFLEVPLVRVVEYREPAARFGAAVESLA